MNIVEVLHFLAGPLIGAVIGYCTNYIAVRMLFRPLEPVKIGSKTLPFTPGIIPKNKDRIAAACGNAVGNTLLKKEDINNVLFNDETENKAVDYIMSVLASDSFRNTTVADVGEKFAGKEAVDTAKVRATDFLCDKINSRIEELDVEDIIMRQIGGILKEKASGGLLSMFINDSLIASIVKPISDKFYDFMETEGNPRIRLMIMQEIDDLAGMTLGEALDSLTENEESQRSIARKIYCTVAELLAEAIMKNLNIVEMIEDKIKEMDVLQFEELVLSVMKKELNAIIRLGALIGFIIGIINAFI